MKQKHTKGVTPIGEALFAHTIKPEEFEGKSTGKYTIMLKLAPEAAEELKEKIEDEWEKFKENPDNAKKKMPVEYANGVKEYKEEEFFKFGMNSEIKLKDGSILEKHVPIFDASKKEISKELTGIGNGSKVRIAYELVPFYMTKANAGVSLRLTAIQIVELVEYGSASADSFGFDAEDGYCADDAGDCTDFEAETAAADDGEEGDF